MKREIPWTTPRALVAGAGLTLLVTAALPLAAGDAAPRVVEAKQSKIVLVTKDAAGGTSRIEIADLHDLAEGETRSFTNDADGSTVEVTRLGSTYRIKTGSGRELTVDAEEGDPRSMVWMSHGGEGDAEQKVVKKVIVGGDGGAHAFAFSGDAEGDLHQAALLARIQASAGFQELDAATRDKVLAILRESLAAEGKARHVEIRIVDKKDENQKQN